MSLKLKWVVFNAIDAFFTRSVRVPLAGVWDAAVLPSVGDDLRTTGNPHELRIQLVGPGDA